MMGSRSDLSSSPHQLISSAEEAPPSLIWILEDELRDPEPELAGKREGGSEGGMIEREGFR